MTERTLLMVKPDAEERNLAGEILRRVAEAGFRLVAVRSLRLRRVQVEAFYEVHRGKPFYEGLVDSISSGAVAATVWEKENAVADLRKFIGPTDPSEAEAGTIRGDFGLDVRRNSVHASDAPETAAWEIAFFFAGRELV